MNSANLKMNTLSLEDILAAQEQTLCIRFCDEWLAEREKSQMPVILEWNARLKGGTFGVIPREPIWKPSDEEVKKLLSEPLTETTDALKLKELEGRFPGATFSLSISGGQGVVRYVYEDFYEDESMNHLISFDLAPYPCHTFQSYGVKGKPTLVAEWHGIQIDLSHLF